MKAVDPVVVEESLYGKNPILAVVPVVGVAVVVLDSLKGRNPMVGVVVVDFGNL